jgi:hypothetical protein
MLALILQGQKSQMVWVLLTMPFTAGEVFGTDKSVLAEKPLAELTGTRLQV